MKKTATILALILLIVGGLGLKAYYDFNSQMLKTIAQLTPAERMALIQWGISEREAKMQPKERQRTRGSAGLSGYTTVHVPAVAAN